MRSVLVVAVALVDERGHILLAQRPEGKAMAGLWEFPGGKVETGELPEAALVRELREELGIAVSEADLKPLTFASHTYETFHLLMPLFACRHWVGAPHGVEGQVLAWAAPDTLLAYPAPDADLPLFRVLAEPIRW
ncbi:MAG: (deoxy)nucleoside triphosphate pyrophosphohydrolase [Pseudomonadota bacterium]